VREGERGERRGRRKEGKRDRNTDSIKNVKIQRKRRDK